MRRDYGQPLRDAERSIRMRFENATNKWVEHNGEVMKNVYGVPGCRQNRE
jgi:hypothetical protein